MMPGMNRVLWALPLILASNVAWAEWSVFEPIPNVTPPKVADDEWSSPIDAFVYDSLRQAQLTPAPQVDRRVWLRRVSYDLVGLPPSPGEVQALINDPRSDADAMAEVVDRLLASPRYGERWGRHWMDVVRYADSDGFAIDEERLTLWRYRDYVIRTLNEDRPFDQFIREQIAGDELDTGEMGKVAVGFYRLGPYEADNMTGQRRRQDYLNEITSAVANAFLGLTVGCARCHDHRFDPIPQSDFYQLQAFFAPLKRQTLAADYLPGEMNDDVKRRYAMVVGQRVELQKQLEDFRETLRHQVAEAKGLTADKISEGDLDKAINEKKAPITPADTAKLEGFKKQAEDRKPEQRFESKAVAVQNPGNDQNAADTFILYNGDVFDPGERVKPGFLSSVPKWSEELANAAETSASAPGGRRKILAQWLTSTDNPITPRVLANRLWQYHFGVGIVATPNDLGDNGSGPSHSELLDYLARTLIDHGWRLKPLHRMLVLSRVYRSAIQHPQAEQQSQQDPDNRLLWRAHHRRLESETIRDAVLAVSGRLELEMGGPGFYEQLPDGMGRSFPFFTWDPSSEQQRRRRSVYMFQRRNLIHPMMEAFDGPDLNQSCESRRTSVTAPQALSLFNSQFAYDNAIHLATRIQDYSADDQQRINRLFWLTLSRAPNDAEMETCCAFLEQKRAAYAEESKVNSSQDTLADLDLRALRDLSLALINTNEFVYLD